MSQPVAQYLVQHLGKSQTVADFFLLLDFQAIKKSQALPDLLQPNVEIAKLSRDGFAMQTTKGEVIPVPQMVFDRLSYTHIAIEDWKLKIEIFQRSSSSCSN